MSSIYDQSSLCVTPNSKKAGKLYSLKGADLDVVRATTATYVGSDGLIKTALANEVRFDYTNGSCPSILVEPQRTNLVFPSATATTQTKTVTATAHTLSFYGTGSVVLSGVATGTLVGTGTSNRVSLTFTPTAGSLILTVVGSVTNWQLEAGANATSYIPTVASTVTRNADVISKTGISDLIGQTEGTLFVDVNYKAESVSKNYLNLGTSTLNYIAIGARTNNKIGMEVLNSGVQVNATSTNTYSTNQRLKIAMTYKLNDFKLYVNGVLQATDTSGTVPAKAEFYLGSYGNGTFQATDRINSAILWKTALTDQECIDLTTL